MTITKIEPGKIIRWLRSLYRWWKGYRAPTEPSTWHVDRDGRVRTHRDRKVQLRAR